MSIIETRAPSRASAAAAAAPMPDAPPVTTAVFSASRDMMLIIIEAMSKTRLGLGVVAIAGLLLSQANEPTDAELEAQAAAKRARELRAYIKANYTKHEF